MWGTRKAICGDLSPIASFIAYNYNTPVDTALFEQEARRILAEVETECGWMYETDHGNGLKGRINYTVWSDVFICPQCGGEIIFWEAAVDKEKGEVREEFPCPHCQAKQTKRRLSKAMVTLYDDALKETLRQAKTVPVLINYTYKGKRHEKTPDAFDLDLIRRIDSLTIPYWFPAYRLPEGDESRRNDSIGITHVHHFYTRRALYVLAFMYEQSKKINTRIKSIIEFLIEQTVIGLSQLNRYSPHHFSQVNRNLSGTLYVGSQVSEVSPFYILDGKIRRVALSLSVIKNFQIITLQSASNYLTIKNNSIDYIFTDPPFGANIMYSELNFLWESWLKVKTNNTAEAIENRTQNKSLFDYQEIMQRCFAEYFRVLKPGRWMTVEFSNTSAAVWNGIQISLQRAGFVIANVAALDKQQGSFKAVTTPTAVKQDLVISCYKPGSGFDERFRVQSADVNVWAFIDEHLAHLPVTIIKGQKTTAVIERSPKILYDRMLTFFLMRGLRIPLDAAEFQEQLRSRYRESDGMVFTAAQYGEYEKQKQKLGIKKQLDLIFDIIYTESDAVGWIREKLADGPLKYNEIMPEFRKANSATRKGEKEFELMTILEENFIKTGGDRWRNADMNEAKDREIFRTRALLREYGRYLEDLAAGRVKKLKDVRIEALRAGFRKNWEDKDWGVIVNTAEKIPQNILMEDEQLLMYYDIAKDRF